MVRIDHVLSAPVLSFCSLNLMVVISGIIFITLSALFTITIYVRDPLGPNGAALLARPHPLFDLFALAVKLLLTVSYVWLAGQACFQWLLVALTMAGLLLMAYVPNHVLNFPFRLSCVFCQSCFFISRFHSCPHQLGVHLVPASLALVDVSPARRRVVARRLGFVGAAAVDAAEQPGRLGLLNLLLHLLANGGTQHQQLNSSAT